MEWQVHLSADKVVSFAFTYKARGSVSFRFLAKGRTSLWRELQFPKPSRTLWSPASEVLDLCLLRKEACKTVVLRLNSAQAESPPFSPQLGS